MGWRRTGIRPVGLEVVHESARTRVTRLFLPGRTLIRKEPLGPDAQRRLRHERAMLERLRGVPGVAQLVEAPRYPGAIVLTDTGGATLAQRAMPLPPDELPGLAGQLARALAALHARHVVHRDVCPANIVLGQSGRGPYLIDFELARPLPKSVPSSPTTTRSSARWRTWPRSRPGAPDGPSTSGPTSTRWARRFTSWPPATRRSATGDPLRLSHAHLARRPTPPAVVNPAVPAALSAIVMHLLEKEPDNRYQTAEGWPTTWTGCGGGAREPGALRVGAHDVPPRLLPQSRMIGRESEIRALDTAFADAMPGLSHGVLVSGAAGVGKTSLVDELRPIASASGGWFVSGKFDQHRRDIEADAVRQAFRALGRLLLAEPEEELVDLAAALGQALGPSRVWFLAAVRRSSRRCWVSRPIRRSATLPQARTQRLGVDLLRTIASPKRPVVFVRRRPAVGRRVPRSASSTCCFSEGLDGLLLVAAFREVDARIR